MCIWQKFPLHEHKDVDLVGTFKIPKQANNKQPKSRENKMEKKNSKSKGLGIFSSLSQHHKTNKSDENITTNVTIQRCKDFY